MPDVIVAGDADTGVYFELPHLPTAGESVLVDDVFQMPGGKGANTAVALSRLGTPTGLLAYVGNDRYGEVARQGLERNQVDCSHLEVVDGSTNFCLVLLDRTGEKALLVVKAAQNYPDDSYFRKHLAYLQTARHVHTIGLDPRKVCWGLESARHMGLTTSVDLDSANGGLVASQALIPHATVVILNEQGARRLYPETELRETAAALQQPGVERVIITRGSQGALGYDGRHWIETPAFQVAVKDTSGAGDCFSAAFVHGYLKGWEFSYNLMFACAAAALLIQTAGPQEGNPTEQQVFEFLDRQPWDAQKGI